jgi:SpoVK/Ycf46/Vps4 family AAA+-type ATPase
MPDLKCAACGRENRDIAKYCRFCGKMITAGVAAPPAFPQIKPATKSAPAADVSAPVSTTPASTPAVPTPSPAQAQAAVSSANAVVVPFDYVGHDNIRAELENIKKGIKFQKKRQSAGVGASIGSKIFVFRGKTGAGKTLVAKHFIEELRREGCLSSDRITNKEARELSKVYGDEYAIAKFLSETKPSALVVDNATENTAYIHELILAAGKTTEECICVIIGNNEGFDEFFGKNTEDRQRVTQDFNFKDLSFDDLSLILMKKLRERGLVFDPGLKEHFSSYIQERKNDASCEYKNGWLIEKDVIPAIDKNQQARLEKLDNAANEDFKTIKAEDLPLKNKPKTVDEILAELDGMIGLAKVKDAVGEIAHTIKQQKKLEEKGGAKTELPAIHLVFYGNPGTGKTTVARKLGALFQAMGLLPSDRVIETDRSGLVAGYVGQTAPMVNAMCDKAMGGILFIDEAYTLSSGGGDYNFGKEAIEALLKRMEDDRGNFVVITAGYKNEMQNFIKTNPGLKSRFTHELELEDYNPDELFAIFMSMAKARGNKFTNEAELLAKEAITDIHKKKGKDFANGRTMRNLLDDTIRKMSARTAKLPEAQCTVDALSTITPEDIRYEKPKVKTTEEILAELDGMIGLAKVKTAVRQLIETIGMQKEREEKGGVEAKTQAVHLCFYGNPGTGKTTVARKLGALFQTMGLLPTDNMLEVTRADMVAGYVGQTAPLVNSVCDKALGGILFVDEAYDLCRDSYDSFGNEAVTTLLKRMEDDRGKFIVITAGYRKEMDDFIQTNSGFRSRFTHFLELDDYNPDELFAIFASMAKSNGYKLSSGGEKRAKEVITEIHRTRGKDFANGRAMRNLLDETIRRMPERLSSLTQAQRTVEALSTITESDFPFEKKEERTVNEILAELDAMIGMTDIKKTVREIADKIQIQKEQEEKDGTKSAGEGNNIVITGNPGTGKTTIVRTLGALFKAIGLLKAETVIEVNGNDLKGSYLGQSKDRVNEKCDEAMGGILFVDEAYVLADTQRGGAVDQYAKEAVEILMTRLENDRTKFVGVVAGYEREMQVFLDTVNPGMRRRFKHYLHLNDYSAEELFAIFNSMVKKTGYTLTADANEAAKAAIIDMYKNKGPNFGNAGEIRVFFEKITSRLATRLAALSKEERSGKLKIIEACDIPAKKGGAQ